MTAVIFGFILVFVGCGCVAIGLVTGGMPPFPSKVAMQVSYRDEEPFLFWMNGALYAASVIWGCYLVVSRWTAFLHALG